ncbi:MAG: hypothetical protein JW982_06070 [Spirochaetes bacterium]|nr:hypothetical protein [Spirochaetota bacterium]
MHTIERFICSKIKNEKLTKAEIVKRIGYRNISKGLRHFDDFLKGNFQNRFILKNLITALGLTPEEWNEVIQATNLEIEKEVQEEKLQEQLSFKPFIYCQTERSRPGQIFIAAMLRVDLFRIIKLPENFRSLCEADKTELRKELIIKKLSAYDGCVPTFGKITAFVQKLDYYDEISDRDVFDLNGDLMLNADYALKDIKKGKFSLNYKNRDLLPLF